MLDFENAIDNLLKDVAKYETIDPNDIPNIDLYMDQVTTFMEKNLKPYKRNDEDKVLTKTMINNYAKAKLFPPPVKKKYTKSHIILLIIIYHLKSILSLNDINKVLTPVIAETEKYPLFLEEVYAEFIKIQQLITKNAIDKKATDLDLYEYIENSTQNEKVKYILSVIFLVLRANLSKSIAEKLIDMNF